MSNLTASRPVPRAAVQSRAVRHPSTVAARLSRLLLRRPRRTLLVGLGLATATAIIVNALVFQKVRHPSPYLSTARTTESRAPSPAAADPRTPVTAVVPPARPTTLDALIRETATLKPPGPVSAAGAQGVPQRPASRDVAVRELPSNRDPIAELIMNGDVRPPADVGRGEVKRPVLPAQKALQKLGYGPVKADGRLGDDMRAAIERFEKDRKLPVTRDLSPRTTRELASASGMRIE